MEERYKEISKRHRANTFIIELPEGGQAVKFYDTLIVEIIGSSVTYRRNEKFINQITRRNMKHYSYLLFKGSLVIKDWQSSEPLFILNGQAKKMRNGMVAFSLVELCPEEVVAETRKIQ